jgi:2-polyprenyl-3-methyl-5-hydroxy-6-metoxy-1,4-benzoquinol methylase
MTSLPDENIYGYLSRVDWLKGHLSPNDAIIEIGCGTGYRITYPLLAAGHKVTGVDTDAASIAYGKRLLTEAGLSAESLLVGRFEDFSDRFDVVIISEVLEHLGDSDISSLLSAVHARLAPSGKLLVTVPNGYGWFELESFLWHKTGLGRVLTQTGLAWSIRRLKRYLVRGVAYDRFASTLSTSPHVQRFSRRTISQRLTDAGFCPVETQGSVLICGPFSDLLFTGAELVMRANRWAGSRTPDLAAGFYIAATKM